MPGERVTFEIGYEGRRMVARTGPSRVATTFLRLGSTVARNVRPFGEDKHTQAARALNHHSLFFSHKGSYVLPRT